MYRYEFNRKFRYLIANEIASKVQEKFGDVVTIEIDDTVAPTYGASIRVLCHLTVRDSGEHVAYRVSVNFEDCAAYVLICFDAGCNYKSVKSLIHDIGFYIEDIGFACGKYVCDTCYPRPLERCDDSLETFSNILEETYSHTSAFVASLVSAFNDTSIRGCSIDKFRYDSGKVTFELCLQLRYDEEDVNCFAKIAFNCSDDEESIDPMMFYDASCDREEFSKRALRSVCTLQDIIVRYFVREFESLREVYYLTELGVFKLVTTTPKTR